MLNLPKILLVSAVVMFANLTYAQSTDASSVSPPSSAVSASGPTAAQSDDPLVQRRIEKKQAKDEYKSRKKIAKQEYKAEKKAADAKLKSSTQLNAAKPAEDVGSSGK